VSIVVREENLVDESEGGYSRDEPIK
jgi:hypothetical protein